MKFEQGKATVFSEALVDENREFKQRRDRVPRWLGWFVRLVMSPEPELSRLNHTRKRGSEKASKGLKRVAGRDERA